MTTIIKNEILDEERALYRLNDINVINCRFDGIKDGESAIKECHNVNVKDSYFNLRYPLWRVENCVCENIEMTEKARSAVWYSKNFTVDKSILNGVKIFRRCEDVKVTNCQIDSIEFGWNSKNILLENSKMKSEYPFLGVENAKVINCYLDTKYPFQQAKNCYIENTTISAKDAFWDSENITCKNCTLIGDFLAWHSSNITLIDCTIISSQPLCYAKKLKLVNCVMEKCDLAFEYSEVDATINGSIKSIKNPEAGLIKVDHVDEIIIGNGINKTNATIIVKDRQ